MAPKLPTKSYNAPGYSGATSFTGVPGESWNAHNPSGPLTKKVGRKAYLPADVREVPDNNDKPIERRT